MYRVEKIQVLFFLALVAFSFSVFAGDYAVVRHLEGKAYVQGNDSSERESLTVNSPVFEGDNIWVVDGSIGILFGDGSIAWLSSDSHIEVSKFPDPVPDPPAGMRIHLWRGTMLLEIPSTLPYESSHFVMTPAASVKAFRKGLSLIEVETVDRTRLSVLEGSALIGSSGQYVTVNQREMSYAEYGYEPMASAAMGSYSLPELVAFRDRSIAKPVRNGRSREYVDPELYPYADDLDYYGGWQEVPSYGRVWFPSPAYLTPGWSPYFNGYWHYTPWGATWVSYEPWGWVPFHYGRWTFVIGLGWGWIPDSFFSPAWVSWYWGDGWIGWCPLGYWGPLWEPCGWYSVQITNIYVTNVTKVVSVHKKDPPPVKPIIPVSKDGSGGVNVKKLNPKVDGDVLVTPHGGLNIPPSKIADIQAKRATFDDLKRVISEPPSSARDRRNSPSSSLDRRDDPIVGKGIGGAPPSAERPAPSSPRTRDSWDRGTQPQRESPTYDEPVRDRGSRTRTYDGDSYAPPSREPSPGREPRQQEQPRTEAPSRETPSRDTQPRRESPGSSETPRSDRSSGDRNVSPPPSYSQPSSPPPSSSDNQSRPSKQRSGLNVAHSGVAVAASVVRSSGKSGSKSGYKKTKSSSTGSFLMASASKKHKK